MVFRWRRSGDACHTLERKAKTGPRSHNPAGLLCCRTGGGYSFVRRGKAYVLGTTSLSDAKAASEMIVLMGG